MEASTMDLHLTSDFLFNASSTTAQVVCEDMNVYLWNSRRDLTTRPLIMGGNIFLILIKNSKLTNKYLSFCFSLFNDHYTESCR